MLRNTQVSSTEDSSAFSKQDVDPEEAPQHLVTAFAAASSHESSRSTPVSWEFLSRRSQATLRKRIGIRDSSKCVFSGILGWEAAHLVRKINTNWVRCREVSRLRRSLLRSSFSVSNLYQDLVHITCTRAPLSRHSAEELQLIEGIYDPRVAVALQRGIHGAFDAERTLAPAVVSCVSAQHLLRKKLTLDISTPSTRRMTRSFWSFAN